MVKGIKEVQKINEKYWMRLTASIKNITSTII